MSPIPTPPPTPPPPAVVSELLILSDGRVLGHNLTPEFTALLAALHPTDPHLRQRQERATAEPFLPPCPTPPLP